MKFDILYRLLCKDDAWVSNILVLKHRLPETSNQTIQLLSWSFFLKCGNGIKEGTEAY